MKTKILLFLFLLSCFYSQAQSLTDNDFSFNTIDKGFWNGANAKVLTVALQGDGKIIIGGEFNLYRGAVRSHIARMNTDGNIDFTFDPGTGTDSMLHAAVLQSDGKVIIAGDFTTYNGVARNHLARLNADGTLDGTFNIGTGANGAIYTTLIQNDGKIIIGGDFTSYNGLPRNRIARLNSDGSLDVSFMPGTGANNTVYVVTVQGDGKVIIGGAFTTYNNGTQNRVARLHSDGSIDSTFNSGTAADSTIYTISLQNDGKLIVAGHFNSFNGVAKSRIARLNTNGSIDYTFYTGAGPAWGLKNTILTTAIQNNGKILIGGDFYLYNNIVRGSVARLNADGNVDSTFNTGIGVDFSVYSIAVQSDNKVIIGGWFGSYNETGKSFIARLHADASVDESFNLGTGADGTVYSTNIQSDGKIIIAGDFYRYNGVSRKRIARLLKDGSLDPSFNPGKAANNRIRTTLLQNDGKIIILGQFETYNGITRNHIARVNTDGSLDTTFYAVELNNKLGGNLYAAALQSDGKIVVVGFFNTVNGLARNSIARLNINGSIDTTFDPGDGPNSGLYSLAIQNDGKIIIGGAFRKYNGVERNGITRLNTNGSLDNTFDKGRGALGFFGPRIMPIVIQSDGKIIMGGDINSYNGVEIFNIVRLNTDGSLDGTFNPHENALNGANNIVVQQDGKFLIIGSGDTDLYRLNSDGSIDQTFPIVSEPADYNTMAVQSDGKIIIGGEFMSYKGVGRNRLARLMGGVTTGIAKTKNGEGQLSFYPNPSTGVFQIQTDNNSNKLTSICVYDVTGRKVNEVAANQLALSRIDISTQPNGVYFIHVKTTQGVFVKKIIKE